jgi:hypothetical protein
MASTELIKDFKDRLHISHSSEDTHIGNLIDMSEAYIRRRCGDFVISESFTGRELVLERAKSAYEGQLAYFDETYEMMIVAFGLDLQSAVIADETTV